MDAEGHFAAATSTGGTANNVPGRVGDVGTAGGTFASHQGAASMTGDGEGIRNLAMACGMVSALDFTDLDGAAQWMFQQARDKHVSAATIFIGRGKGDDQVHVRCTDSDAALTFAYSRGDGNVQVFTANPAQYYDYRGRPKGRKAGKRVLGLCQKHRQPPRDHPHRADARAPQDARTIGRANQEPTGKPAGGVSSTAARQRRSLRRLARPT